MPLSDFPALLTTLKADIAVNTATVLINGEPLQIKDVPVSPDNAQSVANWYNLTAAGNYKLYRTAVPVSEVMTNGFNWTRVDNLSVGKARIWEWMTRAKQQQDTGEFVFDASKTNIRDGINATWVGTQADLDVRAAVYLHCFRNASNAEKLLKSAGAGTVANATGDGPATPGYNFPLSGDDVMAAWAAA